MLDESKVALFDELLACVIQSSHAMNETTKALSVDPLHFRQVVLLNDSLDSTKVMLSKVLINPSSNIRFPLLCILVGRLEKRSLLEPRRKR
jgi:hypothetical protein